MYLADLRQKKGHSYILRKICFFGIKNVFKRNYPIHEIQVFDIIRFHQKSVIKSVFNWYNHLSIIIQMNITQILFRIRNPLIDTRSASLNSLIIGYLKYFKIRVE